VFLIEDWNSRPDPTGRTGGFLLELDEAERAVVEDYIFFAGAV
jgi:hypothetical protein